MAEQTQPLRRKVALRVLKPRMDTRQVVARFEAERQALAIMDHPNIAKVHDGGATLSQASVCPSGTEGIDWWRPVEQAYFFPANCRFSRRSGVNRGRRP